MPTVSVMTPCYNVAPYVGETMRSVQAQTYSDWEHIVVDDGSTDDSAASAREIAATDVRVRVVQQANGGVSSARNTGFRNADPRSKYLLWLDGDDALEPNMLSVLVAYLDCNPHVGFVFSSRHHMDAAGQPIMLDWQPVRLGPGRFLPRTLASTLPETPFASLFAQDALCNPSSSLIRRSVYERCGAWDEAFGQPMEDWDLFFRLALLAPVHYVPERLIRYRMGRPGQSTTQIARGKSQYLKLYDRWARLEGVTNDAIPVVRDAMRFREGQVLPAQWASWGTGNLRQNRIRGALACYAQAARHLAAYAYRSLAGSYRHLSPRLIDGQRLSST